MNEMERRRTDLVDVDLDAGVGSSICAREANGRRLGASAAGDVELRAFHLHLRIRCEHVGPS